MNDLEKIDRLFALKEKGALSDDEFQSEKRRLLDGSSRSADANGEIAPAEFSRGAAYTSSSLPKFFAVTVLCAILGAGFWYFQSIAPSQSKAHSTPDLTDDGHSEQVISEPQPEFLTEPQPTPTEQWIEVESDGDPKIFYGPPASDAGYWLNCHRADGIVEFVSVGATTESGDSVVIDAGKAASFRADVEFETGEWEQASVAIPADSEVFGELRAEGQFLRISWDKGALDRLPNAPVLKAFLTECRKQ